MDLLDDDAIATALAGLDGWRREGRTIHREVRFPSFIDAIRFINLVAGIAEEADHHPEVTNDYRTVGIRLTTHDAGGITARDVALARAIDTVVTVEA